MLLLYSWVWVFHIYLCSFSWSLSLRTVWWNSVKVFCFSGWKFRCQTTWHGMSSGNTCCLLFNLYLFIHLYQWRGRHWSLHSQLLKSVYLVSYIFTCFALCFKDVILSSCICKIFILQGSPYWIFCYLFFFFLFNEEIFTIFHLGDTVAVSADLLKTFVFVVQQVHQCNINLNLKTRSWCNSERHSDIFSWPKNRPLPYNLTG